MRRLSTLVAAAAVGCLRSCLVLAQSDNTCGNATLPLDTSKPNVLIIGDSISMPVPYTPGGYYDNAAAILTAKGVAVQHGGGAFSGGQARQNVKGRDGT